MNEGLWDRFWAKVSPEPNTGCWLWTGATVGGYGQMAVGGGFRMYTHRIAWEAAHGPVPDGLSLDHLCRVRMCCNPTHLEPVTTRVNILRGKGLAAMNAQRTHCRAGHLLVPIPYRPGWRECPICAAAQDRISRRARDAGRRAAKGKTP